MRIGTKSVLFGAHAFWLHPFFVAWAWTKLYGFPTQVWLWIAFFVHDIGYWSSPNMDGPEGESHPEAGANVLYKMEFYFVRFLHWQGVSARVTGAWGNESLWHSRFYATKSGRNPSNLCWADKLAFSLEPWWLYLPRVWLSGEFKEYKKDWLAGRGYLNPGSPTSSPRDLIKAMQANTRMVVEKRYVPARA